MKPSYFRLLLFLVCIFLAPLKTWAAERIQIYPKHVRCGEKVTIGLFDLNPSETYRVAVVCGNLNCTNNFVPKEYAITGKSYGNIQEEFGSNTVCIEEQKQSTATMYVGADQVNTMTKAATTGGKYFARLYKYGQTTSTASVSFDLISNSSNSCSLDAREIARLEAPHMFELATTQACTYTVTLIDPTGKRIPIIKQFVSSSNPLVYRVEAAFLNKKGTYKLTAIGAAECGTDADRECRTVDFTVKGNAMQEQTDCVYVPDNTNYNCLQCDINQICTDNNKCVADMHSICSTPRSALQTKKAEESTQSNAAKNVRNKLDLLIPATLTVGLVLALHFRRKKYKIT